MSGRGRWVALAVGLVVAALVGCGVWVYRNPLRLLEWASRRALVKAGFERVELPVAGGRLVYFRAGEGPPLVLLHGAGDQAGGWDRVAPAFTGGYRVLVPDLPGHGESDPRQGPIPFARVLAGVEALLAGPEVPEPAVVVGSSMGGWLAALVAWRHPEEVARLVLAGGGPVRGEPSGVNLLPESREEARATMAAVRDPGSPPVPDWVLDDLVRRAGSGPLFRLLQDLEGMEAHLLDGHLGEIRTPVDLLWGESDRVVPPAYAERLAAGLPRARLTTLPRCGHLPQNECPRAFTEALREILAAPPPGTGDEASPELPNAGPAPSEPAPPGGPP